MGWENYYDELLKKQGGEVRCRMNIDFRRMMKILTPLESSISASLKQGLSYAYEGLDSLDFKLQNNTGATAKYQIIDGTSVNAIKLCDHDTPLYLLFGGNVTFQRSQLEVNLRWVYFSNDRNCGV